MVREVPIRRQMIRLGQLLKLRPASIIENGLPSRTFGLRLIQRGKRAHRGAQTLEATNQLGFQICRRMIFGLADALRRRRGEPRPSGLRPRDGARRPLLLRAGRGRLKS